MSPLCLLGKQWQTVLTSLCLFAVAISSAGRDGEQINPVPRSVQETLLAEWTFDDGTGGWAAQNQCRLVAQDGALRVQATGYDPFFHCGVDLPGGRTWLQMRARSRATGDGTVYWTTHDSPRGEDKVVGLPLQNDGQWREYETRFIVQGRLTDVRLDPGHDRGEIDIDWIRLIHAESHPLTFERVDAGANSVRLLVRNHSEQRVEFQALGQQFSLAGQETVALSVALRADKPLEAVSVALQAKDLPLVRRNVFVLHPQVTTEWVDLPQANFTLRVAKDGSMARVERQDELVAVLAPLVHVDGKLPALKLVGTEESLRFVGDGVVLELSTRGEEIDVTIESQSPCTGPAVRAFGNLEQGLFAGLEYLGKGEASSSKLDIETDEHLRFAPNPLKVTLPLMACVTDKASLAMTWNDMQLQPIYATPNFYDSADDHRMALAGTKIQSTIRVDHQPLDELILWATRRHGLPPLPPAPRSPRAQRELCKTALNGPLRTNDGWGHCVEERWTRRFYDDIASTVWRLTGEVPEVPELVPGGSHVANPAVYFVTGRVRQFVEGRRRMVQGILQRQQADGSFRYTGEYRRGHFEDTATGVCARPAVDLLEFARLTGDRTALDGGLRTLEYMKRFRTPRGAQVWEVPLHTPDQLAAANLVWAYVLGYELTGHRAYLREARRWALSGIPFTYLWGEYPIMAYATPPVFGSTHWTTVCWIGRPVQWVGGVYAYALTRLSPYDQTLDWNYLARGILIAAEQMQYPDGVNAGLLPDAFVLKTQQRVPANINPCALVSLRMAVDGELDSLAVASDGGHRIVAPFPVEIRDGSAHIQAREGVAYQVLIDGHRIVDVTSQGEDTLELD